MNTAIAGEYYLQGVREMASGFLLRPDHTFQFFFTYGALDRFGAGEWTNKNGHIFFNSKLRPADGYTLISSSKKDEGFINILLEGNNPMANVYTFVSLQGGAEDSWKQMKQQGDVQFQLQQLKTISLMHEFFPDKITTVTILSSDHTEFVFRMEASVQEVFFDNFSLQVQDGSLAGRHPLLQGNEFLYCKQ